MMLNKIVNSKYTFYALMSAYIFYLWDSDGKYGFSPTDEARILGYIERISHGDLPHLDFIFPHLAGTAYLYYFLNFLNSDVIFLQRFLGIITLILYSYLLLKLSGEIFAKQNNLVKILLVILSLNINMHTFSLYIWSTTDAIFLSVIASFLITKSKKLKLVGFFILGSVPIMKSGFLFSTLILYTYFISKEGLELNKILKPSLSFSIVPLSYLSLIMLNSGLDEMFYELFALPKFWTKWLSALGLFDFTLIVLTFITCLPFFFIFLNGKYFDIAIPILFSILFLVLIEDFTIIYQKPRFFLYSLYIFLAIFIQKKKILELKNFELPFLLCLILGFSATLSDGWSVSLWVNGSILSLCILLIFELSNSYKFKTKKFDYSYLSQILIILIIFYIPYSENTEARDNYTYRDLSDNSKLTYNLKNLNKYYGNIYTSENVYNYLESLQKCIGLIDNKNISVYPDNPIIYSMYDLKNPLIIDRYEGYFVSTDYDDIKLYENIAELNSNKDASYAIFLQTYPTSKLIEIESQNINLLNDRNSTGFHPEILKSIEFIKTNLEGDKSTCDSFEIIYKNIEY